MANKGQEVLVLASPEIGAADTASITSTCAQASSSNVLTKLFTGANSSGTNVPSTYILYIPAFRKIEPKPGLEIMKSGEEGVEKELVEKETKPSCGRFLGINATKRGVKSCPVCFNKIGYRAKKCKHCTPSKIRNPRKSRLHILKPQIHKLVDTIATRNKPGVISHQVPLLGPSETLVEDQQGIEVPTCIIAPQEEQQQAEGQQGLGGTSSAPQDDQEDIELTTKDQEELDNSSIKQKVCQDRIDSEKLQDDQGELAGPTEDQLIDKEDQEPIVIEDVEISHVTEVSTSGETLQKMDTEPSQSEKQTFISTKVTPTLDTPKRYSLQDLICGLLTQNQGCSVGNTQREVKENVEEDMDSNTIAIQTEPTKQTTDNTPDETSESRCIELGDGKKSILSENSYDANSVALFLGEMAQRNGKKRRIASSPKSKNTETKVVKLVQGASPKCFILSGNETKTAKLRKIQPKDIANAQTAEVTVCEDEREEAGEGKGDSQSRIMNGNATRRGVMLCIKCSKLIGCRSKVCKHCKNQVTDNPPRQANTRTIKQAVKLCLPNDLNIQMFSVRKCKTGPELRCFVQLDDKSDETPTKDTSCSSKYSCDYPLCVTAKELGDRMPGYICEHAKVCCVSSNVLQVKIPNLDPEKLEEMPISHDMKESVRLLHLQCTAKNIPLVQHVSCKTVVVVEQLHADKSDPLGANVVSFAHVRFENIKGQGCFQRQVFCSGRSCMAWNFLSNDSHANVIKPCSCVHYAAALWAIASDIALQHDFQEYLDAFFAQAKVGNTS